MPTKEEIVAQVEAQGNEIREAKKAKAAKDVIMPMVEKLNALKKEYETVTGEPYPTPGAAPKKEKKKQEPKADPRAAKAAAKAAAKGGKQGDAAKDKPKPKAPAPAPAPAPAVKLDFSSLGQPELAALLCLAGLDASGAKPELLARLQAAAQAGAPTDLGALRARIRTMEERIGGLESGATPMAAPAAAAAAAAPAAAPEPAAGGSEITPADVAAYVASAAPKISGKPTDEQKKAIAVKTAEQKKLLKAIAERIGATEKQVKKELEKMAKDASKAPEAKVVELPPVSMSVVADLGPNGVPSTRFGQFVRVQSQLHTGRKWTEVQEINAGMAGTLVWVRARKYQGRASSKKLCFVTLRQQFSTVQCVVAAGGEIPVEMSQFVAGVPNESVVDVLAKVSVPGQPISGCTQSDVELTVEALFVVSKSEPKLPLQVLDASRSQQDIDEAEQKDPTKKMVRIAIDTRLDNRMIDLRTPANQSIMKVNGAVGQFFREFLTQQGFTEIHSPKIIAGASEGGAAVFKLNYMRLGPACLAQSPQLYKQMGVCTDLRKVFEVGPVFRAENSTTNRHLCEYTGLDYEMAFQDHYSEVLDVTSGLFGHIFDNLKEKLGPELEAIRRQYPFEDLLYTNPMKRLTHKEAVDMLHDWGTKAMPPLRKETPAWMIEYLEDHVMRESLESDEEEPPQTLTPLTDEQRKEMGPYKDKWVTVLQCAKMGYMDDFTTPQEKQLGRIMHDDHRSDFYIVDKFPLCVRPFYTMPDPNEPEYSNSYDIFLRGEEIMSGAQRIHDPELLIERCQNNPHGAVPLEDIKDYIDAFKYGAYPHAGGGVGLERVVMLYLGLPNIRLCTLFPRDPNRMTP